MFHIIFQIFHPFSVVFPPIFPWSEPRQTGLCLTDLALLAALLEDLVPWSKWQRFMKKCWFNEELEDDLLHEFVKFKQEKLW
jgi:hypothetical protein